MGFPKQVITLLVLLCCYATAKKVHNEATSVSIGSDKNKEIVQGTLFATDHTSYPYAICEWSKPKTEKTCQIKLIDKPRKERVCNGIKVFTNDEERELFFNGYFQVTPFSQDHVIVGWWDTTKENAPVKKQNLKISILNMLTCQTAHLDYPIDNPGYGRFPSLLLFPNQVDVIVNSKSACAGAPQCRLSYDLNGQKIGQFPYTNELLGYTNPVSESGPDKGFFVSAQNLKNLRVMFVDNNADGRLLSTDEFEPQAVKQRVYFNSAHEKYTICRMPDMESKKPTTIHCKQYSAAGIETIKNTVTLQDTTHWLAVRSLAEGGYLLATSGCDVSQSAASCPDFRVWMINESNKSSEPKKIEGPKVRCDDSSSDLQVRITEQRDMFCFDFSCLEKKANLTYVRKCVDKESVM